MKATRILLPCAALLLLGGCLEPIPYDSRGYPNRNPSLRYPPNYTRPREQGPGPSYNDPNNRGNRWERPPGSGPAADPGYPPYPTPRPTVPEPRPEPRPKPPETRPLVDIDPIEEADKPKYEYAIPVQGASNLVVSPFAKEGPYIDISGLSSGTQIECPKTKKTILVP